MDEQEINLENLVRTLPATDERGMLSTQDDKEILHSLANSPSSLAIIDAFMLFEHEVLEKAEPLLDKITDEQLLQDIQNSDLRMSRYINVAEHAHNVKDSWERRIAVACSILGSRRTLKKYYDENMFPPGRTYDALLKMSQIGSLIMKENHLNITVSIYRKATELSGSKNRCALVRVAAEGEFSYTDTDLWAKTVRHSEHTLDLEQVNIVPGAMRMLGRVALHKFSDGTRQDVLCTAVEQANARPEIVITTKDDVAELLDTAYKAVRENKIIDNNPHYKQPEESEQRDEAIRKLHSYIEQWAKHWQNGDFQDAAISFTDATIFWREINNDFVYPHVKVTIK